MLVVLLTLGDLAPAQTPAPPAPQLEARFAAPVSPRVGLLAGVAVDFRAGWYARISAGALAGAVRRGDGWQDRQQFDFTARFLFDPYAERRVGLYGGAGLGLSREAGVSSRGELLLLAGAEGHSTGRLVPAIEIVIGGGVRLQGVLRARRSTGR